MMSEPTDHTQGGPMNRLTHTLAGVIIGASVAASAPALAEGTFLNPWKGCDRRVIISSKPFPVEGGTQWQEVVTRTCKEDGRTMTVRRWVFEPTGYEAPQPDAGWGWEK